MDHPTTLALQVSTEMLTINRRFEEAIAQGQRAIDIDPNDARSHVTLAEALTFAGQPGEAIEHIQRAMRLDPHSPASYLFALDKAQFMLRRYEDAIVTLERATRRNPDDDRPSVVLTAAYGQLGRKDEASATLVRLNALLPRIGLSRFTVTMLRNRWPFKRSNDLHPLKDGLRNAGVPEY